MSFRPIEGQLGLYQDTDTGQIVNVQDFKMFERAEPFPRGNHLSFVTSEFETWVLDHWSIVLHPWHEVIDPALSVSLTIQARTIVSDVPLFRLAEPLARSEKSDLEKRIELLEKAAMVRPVKKPVWRISTVVQPMSKVDVRISGSSDALGHLHEMTKHFLVSFHGIRRVGPSRRA